MAAAKPVGGPISQSIPIVPSGIALQEGDIIRGAVAASTAIQCFVTLNIVFQDGSSGAFNSGVVTSASDRSQKTFPIVKILHPGVIVSAIANTDGAAPTTPAVLYYAAFVRRGDRDIAQFIGGYLYIGHVPSFPGPVQSKLEGPGRLYTVTGTNPAAGAEVTETVPTNARWRLRAFSVVLVTSATVANRNVSLVIDDGTAANRRNVQMEATVTNITASLTRTLQWNSGYDVFDKTFTSLTDTQTVLVKAALPQDVFLEAGSRIRTVTANLQAGDDYAAPIYEVEEWFSE